MSLRKLRLRSDGCRQPLAREASATGVDDVASRRARVAIDCMF